MTNIYLLIIFAIQIQINYSQFLSAPDPIQHFKRLQQDIGSNIFSINNHYSELTRRVQNTIQNIISRSSISQSLDKLGLNINSFDQSPCTKISNDAINSLSTSSRDDVSTCASSAVTSLTNNVTIEAEKLIRQFVSIQGDITSRVATCFKGNFANQVGQALCLVAQINPVEIAVASLTQEIEKTFAMSEAVAQDIIFTLGNCILSVENVVDAIATNIVTDFKSCING